MRIRPTLLSFCAVMFLFLGLLGCGGGGDSAGALDARLADALDFDGGEVVAGAPPSGTEGSTAPQVALLTAPGSLSLGNPFIVSVTADFSLPTDVDKAVVYVGDKPGRHILVTRGLVQSGQAWQMNLSGVLTPDDQLKGKSFTVHIALQTKTGVTGVYGTWSLTVASQSDVVPTGDLVEKITITGEVWHASGRPAGSADPSIPQVSGAEAPTSVAVGEPFSVTLRSDNLTGAGQVAAVLVTTPGRSGYKLTTGFTIRQTTRSGSIFLVQTGMTVSDDRLAGFDLVLLLALRDGAGQTGLFYPVGLRVTQAGSDGDVTPDGDSSFDGDAATDGDALIDGDPASDGDTMTGGDTAVDGDASTDGDTETGGDTEMGPTWFDPATSLLWQNPRAEVLMAWQTGVDYCQDLVLDGHDDWRLPGIGELRSLVRGCPQMEADGACNVREGECLFGGCGNGECYECAYLQGPGRDGMYTESDLVPEVWSTDPYYWSSAANVDETAYCLAYNSASLRGYYTFNELGIRCVRGGSGADGDSDTLADGDVPDGDETPHPDIWFDPVTGLFWQRNASSVALTWDPARTYCEGLSLGGRRWRLPDIVELRSLVRNCPATEPGGSCPVSYACLGSSCRTTACDGCASNGGPDGGCYWDPDLDGMCVLYWSVTELADVSTSAWTLSFARGLVGQAGKTSTARPRCVSDPVR